VLLRLNNSTEGEYFKVVLGCLIVAVNKRGWVSVMKNQIQWIALVMTFVVGIAGSMGCATMAAREAASRHSERFNNLIVLTDEIVAIGHLDDSLAQSINQKNVVAFLGKKNTYLIYKGGDELERISQLKLNGRRMDLHATDHKAAFKKDNVVWGALNITYGATDGYSLGYTPTEKAALKSGGFVDVGGVSATHFYKRVDFEGVVYPALRLSGEQMSKLTVHRSIDFYQSKDAKVPVNVPAMLLPAAVVVDVVLAPVYAGVFGVGLVGLAISGGPKR